MSLAQLHHCAECGSELPSGLPAGLCPICALRMRPEPQALPDLAVQPGNFIGRYKLLQKIGEGGMGDVWMAEQSEPIRRQVALKVVKLGMDTKSVIARFEAERQALALMDHPHIAKILDAGATEAGRPYFVMELVRGMRITHYCDEQKLATSARLHLFMQVCHAIQHAHQKGIIHRDIKPSNILITLQDGVPVPKVIDFGIAKATSDQQLTDRTLFTAFEQFMGTPAYMSPEQAEMVGLDIDTRTDIYSLGVLLYELLTGNTPFDPKELLAAGFDAMRRTIREKEPAKPSTRLKAMLEMDRTKAAKHRQTEPNKLATMLRGDLDWIVMKALEKDRSRRYGSANEFVADIKSHLANEPVTARSQTLLYLFIKLFKRNKVLVTGTTIVVVASWIFLAVSTYSFITQRKANARLDRMLKMGRPEIDFNAIRVSRELAEASRVRAAETATRWANQQLVKRYFEDWGSHANTAIAEQLMVSNLVVRQGFEIIKGLEEYNRRLTNLHARLTDIRFVSNVWAPEKNSVVSSWMLTANSRSQLDPTITTHKGVLSHGISVFHITNGRIETIDTVKEEYVPREDLKADVFFTFP